MPKTIDLFNQLKNAGIPAKLVINLSPDGADIARVKQLQAELKNAGVTPEVHINVPLDMSSQEDSTPATPVDEEQTRPAVIRVPKANCRLFTKKDQAGKPIMQIREPRVQLFQGSQFNVSATHKAGDKDPGDGTVVATGGINHYLVVDCPANRDAEGLYVREPDITLL